jgi:hypothetical protein
VPRGRNWYGPGFWKDPRWVPGAGGFRGGYAFGPGPGWGYCRMRWTESGPEDEKTFLQEQAEALKAELAELEKRLSEIESA